MFVCYIEYCLSVTIIYPLPYAVVSPHPPHSHVCIICNEILVNQKYKSTRLLRREEEEEGRKRRKREGGGGGEEEEEGRRRWVQLTKLVSNKLANTYMYN